MTSRASPTLQSSPSSVSWFPRSRIGAPHPVAQRPQDPVVDGCELGGDFVGDRKDLLQRFEF